MILRIRSNLGAVVARAFLGATLATVGGLGMSLRGQVQPRVIEVLADHDSRYKMEGLKQPMIAARAGEQVTLRITAKRAKERNRDGAIHGFALLRAKDRKAVDGWDLSLRPGTQEFHLTVPSEPGDYIVICTVICSQDHEGMNLKFVVEP